MAPSPAYTVRAMAQSDPNCGPGENSYREVLQIFTTLRIRKSVILGSYHWWDKKTTIHSDLGGVKKVLNAALARGDKVKAVILDLSAILAVTKKDYKATLLRSKTNLVRLGDIKSKIE